MRRAVVRSVLQGGAFCDIGLGVEVSLPANQYDGRYLADLRRFVNVGDDFEVVLHRVQGRTALISRAVLLPDPREMISQRYQQGGLYPATVVGQTPNRAYLMLELPGGTLCYARHPEAGDPPAGRRVGVKLRAVNREKHRLYVSVIRA